MNVTISDAATRGKSGRRSDDNEGVFTVPKAPAILKPHNQIV